MNNALIPFDSASDITNYLREQFAGLFQKLLLEKATITEQTTYYDLKETISQLKLVVGQIDNERQDFVEKLEATIFAQKPFLRVLRHKLDIKRFAFFASDKEGVFEMLYLMGFKQEEDSEFFEDEYVFLKLEENTATTLYISKKVFNDKGTFADLKTKELQEMLEVKIEDIEEPEEDIPF